VWLDCVATAPFALGYQVRLTLWITIVRGDAAVVARGWHETIHVSSVPPVNAQVREGGCSVHQRCLMISGSTRLCGMLWLDVIWGMWSASFESIRCMVESPSLKTRLLGGLVLRKRRSAGLKPAHQ
jgi:hypothetical protein